MSDQRRIRDDSGFSLPIVMHRRWRHLKTGGEYTLVGTCRIEATNVPAYAYKSDKTGVVWVRPMAEFLDGRFERIAAPIPERTPPDEPTDHEAMGAMIFRGKQEARNNGGNDE